MRKVRKHIFRPITDSWSDMNNTRGRHENEYFIEEALKETIFLLRIQEDINNHFVEYYHKKINYNEKSKTR